MFWGRRKTHESNSTANKDFDSRHVEFIISSKELYGEVTTYSNPYVNVATFSGVGSRDRNNPNPQEDVIYLNVGNLILGSVCDGMGGLQNSRAASEKFIAVIKRNWNGLNSPSHIHYQVATQFIQDSITGGVCHLTFAYYPMTRELTYFSAGDVHLKVFSRNRVVHESPREADGNIVHNYITSDHVGSPNVEKVVLRPGSVIVIGSDGVWNHVNGNVVAGILRSEGNVLSAAQKVGTEVNKKGIMYPGSWDNSSLIIIQPKIIKDQAGFEDIYPDRSNS